MRQADERSGKSRVPSAGPVGGGARSLYGSLYRLVRGIHDRHPRVRPLMRAANRILRLQPPTRFRGWGMTTEHALPWEDAGAATAPDAFLLAHDEVKAHFRFTGEAGVDHSVIDELMWRHWNVCLAVRYALRFARQPNATLVECGVADGTTAYFALREAEAEVARGATSRTLTMHLYDAWERMPDEPVLPSEAYQRGRYGGLSLDTTRKNLARFEDRLVYHVGYIPQSFADEPAPPRSVSYLHVDLNSAVTTLATCEHFWPLLVRGGVMLFDDYGWLGFEDTRRVVDRFVADKPGVLMQLPTAQAMFFRS